MSFSIFSMIEKPFGNLPRLCVGLLAVASLLFSAGVNAQGVKPAAKPETTAKAEKWVLKLEKMNVQDFVNPTVIDNKWIPMKPGTRWTYEGTTVEDDGKVVPHKIVINITDMVKEIGGVLNVVTYDLDYKDGELEEAELAFFAQDKHGTVWFFGEYPEEYDGKKIVKTPAWLHGIEGASAGIRMKANPNVGGPSYSQGYGPAVKWTDRGQAIKAGEKVTVRAGKYDNVLVVRESSKEEGEDAYQLKYYAQGVGNIKVGWGGAKEKTQETLELVKVEQMSAAELADVRKKALAMEKSAYQQSKNVYGKTKPMQPRKD